MPLPVVNETCVYNRSVGENLPTEEMDFDTLMEWYAGELLHQIPCMRMMDHAGRKVLYQDPSLKGIIYHTVKFCDFYSFEYAQIKQNVTVPLLKIESDYTVQSSGQLLTRLEAFAESMNMEQLEGKELKMGKGYFAGIDSGSTSTDVVILDKDQNIVTGIILPTGAGAAIGADRALEEALKDAGLQREDIDAMVTTGYGRTAISDGDKSITEITCHARGAHFLNPEVRTVIDIGGQDSKVIRLDENGAVANFVMNDKCAAGTGRFLEMMARTMEMSLDDMGKAGLSYKEDITISSMCTVFAESEVVSLIAQNKATDDIVHGLNKAVASKTAALAKRVGGEERYMMTGGVSKNQGLVKTLEEKLGTTLVISDKAQLCGPLKFYHQMDSSVGLMKLIPSADASLLDYMAAHYDAVIIESFGVGGLPSYDDGGDYYRAVAHWISLGKTVIMTTQVTNEGSNMSVYEVGKKIKREFGLLEAYDMTLEAAVTKIMWILTQTKEPAKVRELFYQTVNHDILWKSS